MTEKKTQIKNKNLSSRFNEKEKEIVEFMSRQNGAIIEGIRSDMKIYQDQLTDINNKVDDLTYEVGFIKNYLQENLEPRVSYLETNKR